MNFLSDTTAPAHPSILASLTAANTGYAASYGADPLSAELRAKLSDVFATDVELVLTTSGTASNALALSVLCSPHGMILCHDEAHIHRDERGAPEFFTGGAKLLPLAGKHAKVDVRELDKALNQWPQDFVHAPPPRVLSLSNLNESGCAYSPAELTALTGPAKSKALNIHFDGARFANALVSSGEDAASMSWKSGADILCLGATKNGALGAEAILMFGDARQHLPELLARQKRSGHMGPKARYIAAQMLAWLKDDLWLELAKSANATAIEIASTLRKAGADVIHPVNGNEVFVGLEDELAAQLTTAGVGFYQWPDGSARFVASWSTTDSEIRALEKVING